MFNIKINVVSKHEDNYLKPISSYTDINLANKVIQSLGTYELEYIVTELDLCITEDSLIDAIKSSVELYPNFNYSLITKLDKMLSEIIESRLRQILS